MTDMKNTSKKTAASVKSSKSANKVQSRKSASAKKVHSAGGGGGAGPEGAEQPKWTKSEAFRVSLVLVTVFILAVIFSAFILRILGVTSIVSKQQRTYYILSIVLMFFEFCFYSYIWYSLICEQYQYLICFASTVIIFAIVQIVFQVLTHGNLIPFNVLELLFAGVVIYYALKNRNPNK